MARQKSNRFKHNQEADNVIERGKPLYTTIKKNWLNFFKNDNPLCLELACGKGEYTVGLANNNSNKNYIGIDIKGDRIARGSKRAEKLGLKNAAFLRTGITYLEEFFDENEISEIWLIHPDPQARDKDEKKRLTNPDFLELYKKILKPNGLFLLKTDSKFLFDYSLAVISEDDEFEILDYTENLYNSNLYDEHFGIETHYEKLFREKGHSIYYIKCQLKKA